MRETKNKEPIDYSKFFEKQQEKVPVEFSSAPVEKKQSLKKKFRFSLGFLKDYWREADKKTRIELITLLVVVVLIIVFLGLYFSQQQRLAEVLPPPLPAEY